VRTLNIKLTAILIVVVIVSCVGVHLLHGYQIRRNAYVFLDAAERDQERAEQAGKEKKPLQEQKAYLDEIKNLGWYVRLMPDDVDTMERLGLLLANRAQDNRMFSMAFGTLERVLRLDPERQKSRRRLVDMALMIRRYQDAKEHLQEFLLKQSPDDAELWELLGRCYAETGEYEKAVEQFKKAIEFTPSRVEVYPRLAGVLRYHSARPKEADQWMEKLVENNPKSAQAHFLHGSYLKSIDSDDKAMKEAMIALSLSPDNRDALWLAAQCYLSKDDFNKARTFAQRGIKLYPDNITMYTTLADIELRAGNRDKAITALQDGLKATERSPQLLWSKANLLIDVNRLKDAEAIVDELRATDYPKQLIDYLTARIEFVQGHWFAARQGFERVRGMLTLWPNLLKQVDVWIGQCYGQVGNRDLQLEAYRRALNVDPFYAPARAGITESLLASGNVDDALKEYSQLAKTGKVGNTGLIPLARMLVLQNLKKNETEREWKQVEKVLDQAEKATPDAVQIPILRAEILVARDRIADAEELLKKAIAKNPKQVELTAVLASLAERQQDWSKTEAILNDLKKSSGDSVDHRLANAQYLVRRYGTKADVPLRKLAEGVDRFSDAERLQLWNGLLNAAMQINDSKQARSLGNKIAEKEPFNVQVRYLLFEQALHDEDEAAMDEALKEIERVSGHGAYWLYGQAVRLGMKAKDKENAGEMLSLALKYLAQAREQRQSWSRIPLLMAGIYDQQGKTDSALKNYLEAIDMGERNPGAIRRTVQLLFQKQRYADADQLLRQLEKQQVPFSADMSRAGAEVALRQGEFERALDMARKAASSKSKNYQEQVWLGQVLSIIGRRAKAEGHAKEAEELFTDAEKALRRAVELEPKNPATWVALIQFLSATEAESKAEKAIQEAGKKLPPKTAPLAMAQCYEVMKKKEAAEEKYEAALAADPQDPFVVRSVADFYCRTGKPVPAEALLRRVIDGKIKASDADVVWARRQLALIFAARGGYQNIQKARDLIEENLAADDVSVLDRRVQASLDAADPKRSQRDKAIATLESMLQEQAATPEDRFKLAQMYLAAGSWVKASAQMRNLVASYGEEPRYLAAYITALMEHGETSNAEVYLDRLEKSYPNHIITVGLRAETLTSKGDADRAFDLLKAFIDKKGAHPAERNLRIRLVAEKLEQLAGRLTKPAQKKTAERFIHEAEVLYRSYTQENAGQEWVLAAFFGRQGRIDEALDLLDRTWESANPAILSQVCSILLRDNKIGKEQLQRLDKLLRTAMKQFDRPIPLLMIMADLSSKLTRYDEAEGYYREVLAKNSGNAYAMNNLAVLLALQGLKLEESLKLIDQAIEIAGPMAPMLDSRASVYIALNDADSALTDMADALADAETPVRYFHQAQAYELAGQHNAAAASMEKAMKLGLTKDMLQPLEIPAFEKLSQLQR